MPIAIGSEGKYPKSRLENSLQKVRQRTSRADACPEVSFA
jgi:hypothetical protein